MTSLDLLLPFSATFNRFSSRFQFFFFFFFPFFSRFHLSSLQYIASHRACLVCPASQLSPAMSARPTHFLCIPLLSSSSTPQLASSLRSFTETISQPPHAHLDGSPLLPAEAIRPLGTLHLTLGVMNLSSQPALDAAISLLRSLDLKAIASQAIKTNTDAGNDTARTTTTSTATTTSRTTATPTTMNTSSAVSASESASSSSSSPVPVSPPTINLAGLNALPAQKSASVLYAKPIQDTSSSTPTPPLSPFASALRQQFIDAGLMKLEYVNDAARQRVPRPLLLHATIANTLYAPKPRRRPARGGFRGARSNNNDKLTIDTTELLYAFNQPTPFVWAKNIPIDRVCICEMGAKPLADDADGLGQAYRVVEEKLLL